MSLIMSFPKSILQHDIPSTMSETWIIPEKFIQNDAGTEGYFFIPGNSLWFSGHFPNMPILPGIGMLGMVYDTLSSYTSHHGIRLTIQEIKRVRFRQIIGSEAHFNVSISLKTKDPVSQVFFQCMSGSIRVCDGILVVNREGV